MITICGDCLTEMAKMEENSIDFICTDLKRFKMQIILEGPPIAKKRAKHAKRGNFTITYDPQHNEKMDVKTQMRASLSSFKSEQVKTLSEAKYLKVSFVFSMQVPESDSKADKIEKLWQFQLPSTKPDLDNLEKFYLDCANGVLWSDDRVVVDLTSRKIYGKHPYVEIQIDEKKGFVMSENWSKIIKCFTPDELDVFLYDAYNIGNLWTENHLIDADDEEKKEYLERIGAMTAVFVANHAEKIKKIYKKI